jgi:hypothetical protein
MMDKAAVNNVTCPFCRSDSTNSVECRCSQCGRNFVITTKPSLARRHAWFIFSGSALVLGFATYPLLVPLLDETVLRWFVWLF